jgi:hypothetical protein
LQTNAASNACVIGKERTFQCCAQLDGAFATEPPPHTHTPTQLSTLPHLLAPSCGATNPTDYGRAVRRCSK